MLTVIRRIETRKATNLLGENFQLSRQIFFHRYLTERTDSRVVPTSIGFHSDRSVDKTHRGAHDTRSSTIPPKRFSGGSSVFRFFFCFPLRTRTPSTEKSSGTGEARGESFRHPEYRRGSIRTVGIGRQEERFLRAFVYAFVAFIVFIAFIAFTAFDAVTCSPRIVPDPVRNRFKPYRGTGFGFGFGWKQQRSAQYLQISAIRKHTFYFTVGRNDSI